MVVVCLQLKYGVRPPDIVLDDSQWHTNTQ
ncbi:MAG: hypothetical protein JWL97_777 [Gemmatimonadales bacterium]|nr:hypothetical protein [Gemmatimonadales bacterium]